MRAAGGDWGIVGVSLVRPDQRDRLAPQGFAYTALELGPDGETPQVVDVVEDVLVAPEDPEAVVARMADPAVRIVSLTVTEKGYCHDPATGRLNRAHPDIVHDLANPAAPRSAPGFLVRALDRRRAAGAAPFTVLTCDNLPDNGAMARGVVLELGRLVDPALADWIAAEGAFPSTMVDRIVPATKPEDIERVAALTGRLDLSPVLHEPFRQWVVEDHFVGGARPDLGAVGVQLVEDVRPFELMKLRMLNGTHSSLAYLGYLAGHETIADTVADPVFAGFVRRLWTREIIPTLAPPPGEDLGRYADALFARYSNPAIRHRTWQIAMDGSQKLPQRILGTLADNRAAGRPIARPRARRRRLDALRRRRRRDGRPDRRPRPACRPPEGPVRRRRRSRRQGRGGARGGRDLPARARRRPGAPPIAGGGIRPSGPGRRPRRGRRFVATEKLRKNYGKPTASELAQRPEIHALDQRRLVLDRGVAPDADHDLAADNPLQILLVQARTRSAGSASACRLPSRQSPTTSRPSR